MSDLLRNVFPTEESVDRCPDGVEILSSVWLNEHLWHTVCVSAGITRPG